LLGLAEFLLELARTLTDLAGRDTIDVPDIGVAVAYRQLDRAAVS
jgi:histone H3/H4